MEQEGPKEELVAFGLLELITKAPVHWNLNLQLLVDLWRRWRPMGGKTEIHHIGLGIKLDIPAILSSWLSDGFKMPPSIMAPPSTSIQVVNSLVSGDTINTWISEPDNLENAKKWMKAATAQIYFISSFEPTANTLLQKLGDDHVFQTMFTIVESSQSDIVPYCMRFLWVAVRVLGFWERPRSRGEPIREWAIEFAAYAKIALHQLFPAWQNNTSNFDFGRDAGLLDRWIDKIRSACVLNPQNVLGSELLDEMLKYYEKPRSDFYLAIGLSAPEHLSNTWLKILQGLKQECEVHGIPIDPNVDTDEELELLEDPAETEAIEVGESIPPSASPPEHGEATEVISRDAQH